MTGAACISQGDDGERHHSQHMVYEGQRFRENKRVLTTEYFPFLILPFLPNQNRHYF
jgi:hypothetical protein